MKKSDRRLRMHVDISRRDFLNGVGVAVGASLLPTSSPAADVADQDLPGYYPPKLKGMRGLARGLVRERTHGARWTHMGRLRILAKNTILS